MKRPYDLTSMTGLIHLEVAARTGGFKLAARELNVTPAAVSQQIKSLEAELGCLLFDRHNRGVQLTEKGAFLFLAVQRGIEGISDAVKSLREQNNQVDVTVLTTTAISSLWLTPKISSFWKFYPTVSVSQIVSDAQNPSASEADLQLAYEAVTVESENRHCLFEDQIIPVATKQFKDTHKIQCVKDLIKAPLVHFDQGENDWMEWNDWFAAFSLPEPEGRAFVVNNFMIALQAVQDDVGAMLGWKSLIRPLLESGKLVVLTDDALPTQLALHLRVRPHASEKARTFASLLIENS